MPATRSVSLPVMVTWLFAMVLVVAGCHKGKSPPGEPGLPPRQSHPGPRPSASGLPGAIPKELARLLADAGARPDGGAKQLIDKEVARIRERKLTLTPRGVPAQRIAFSHSALAQLTTGALIVRYTKTWKERTRFPVRDPRRVVVLAGGGFLALSGGSSYRLDPGKKSPGIQPSVTLFPGSLVFPDRHDKNRFWVLHAFAETLYRYQLGSAIGALMGIGDFFDLKGFDHEAFAALKDGSFLFTTAKGLRRFYPGGKTSGLGAPPGEGKIWRLLTAKRLDRVWVARGSGDLRLVQLRPGLPSVEKIELAPTLFDIAASDRYVAALRVEQPDGGPRRWKLAVYDAGGKPELEVSLPPGPAPPPGEGWVQVVTRDRSVVLAPHAPLVAVGGPGALTVWNVKTGKAVLSWP